MAADDACVADPLDTVHHEIDSVIHNYHVPVIGEQIILEKEPAGQSTWWICSGSDKEFSDNRLHSIRKIIHRSRGILFHEGTLSSIIQNAFIIMDPQKT